MSVDYLGFVKVGERTPLLVRADDSEREKVLRSAPPGGVIFTRAEDMPSLEDLLAAHAVDYAVLQLPLPLEGGGDLAPLEIADWRDEARSRLIAHVEGAQRDEFVFDEDLSFVPSLAADALDAFLARADSELQRRDTSPAQWDAFLLAEDQRVVDDHATVEDASEEHEEDDAPAPLFTTEHLRLNYSSGALGGPAPLASHSVS
jgi:hypothetical protein